MSEGLLNVAKMNMNLVASCISLCNCWAILITCAKDYSRCQNKHDLCCQFLSTSRTAAQHGFLTRFSKNGELEIWTKHLLVSIAMNCNFVYLIVDYKERVLGVVFSGQRLPWLGKSENKKWILSVGRGCWIWHAHASVSMPHSTTPTIFGFSQSRQTLAAKNNAKHPLLIIYY